jgi:ABC-type sugar transport system ATPase subunit
VTSTPTTDALSALITSHEGQRGQTILSVSHASKRFGTTQALADASLQLRGGEVHALLGENGAGKSTLIKILVGGIRPDTGEVRIDGQPAQLHDVPDAIGRGILPIYQQLSLMPHLSVLENLLAFELARGRALAWSDTRRHAERARQALAAVGLDVDLGAPIAQLSLAQRQLVEIARSVIRDCRVLLLDEPTTSLTGNEIQVLFRVLETMRAEGRAILFISHRLDEVEHLADRITVLRDGRSILESVKASGLSRRDMVEAMVGHQVQQPARRAAPAGPAVLSARSLAVPGGFRDVDLDVRRGEVLGIVGLIGSGATELAQVLAGDRPIGSGTVELEGRALRGGDRAAALRAGVGYIPADRDRDGLFPGQSVLHNASASSLWRLARRGWLRVGLERKEFSGRLHELRITPADPDADITALSGGNRQKALVARNLTGTARVLVALEPTRGVDIAARQEIHQAILAAASEGLAVVVASSDLDEVMALSDRVIVMRSGRMAAEVQPDAGVGEIVHHLTGARR